DRVMFYCPTCQGGLGPTDDGLPQGPLGSSGGRRTSYRP
ncbi:MAG: Fpg/Nei family DNA glycosylase, partial [Actinobacteria bacterium]|nr:Fpg/Nei family DNA glycosylase [Actinomycetota bacterium]